jgi:hypothetical protein
MEPVDLSTSGAAMTKAALLPVVASVAGELAVDLRLRKTDDDASSDVSSV